MVYRPIKQKSLHPHQGRRVAPRYHPDSIEGLKVTVAGTIFNIKPSNFQTLFFAITGLPAADYSQFTCLSPAESSFEITGEFGLCHWHSRYMPLKGFHLTFPSR